MADPHYYWTVYSTEDPQACEINIERALENTTVLELFELLELRKPEPSELSELLNLSNFLNPISFKNFLNLEFFLNI